MDKENKLQFIIRHTNYNSDEALLKLKYFDDNYIDVIKDFYKEKKSLLKNTKINAKETSLNQAIYKEIRNFIDIKK